MGDNDNYDGDGVLGYDNDNVDDNATYNNIDGNCNGATGNEVDADGDGMTGYDDDDNGDGRQRQQR